MFLYIDLLGGIMESSKVNYDFAKAWDISQGNFAQGIAESILRIANDENRKIKSVLDVCCGASNLLGVFYDKGFDCYGTETRQGFIDCSKEKYPHIKYSLTTNMYDIPVKKKVDLVTCTHDVVNYFENFNNWESFFKDVSKILDKNGMFVFDFYTKFKLKDWNETTYKSSGMIDCLTDIKSGMYDKTVITYTYYLNYSNYFIKTRDIIVESYYEEDQIFDALKKAGFKNVKIVDHNLNPIDDYKYAERIHVIAMKK